jgi:hypothetical protein
MEAFKSAPTFLPGFSYHEVELPKQKFSRPSNPQPIPLSQKFIVGASAGILGTSIIYPIDLMKTQLQSTTGQSFSSTVSRVFRAGGLYRGFSACLIGIAPEKAIKLAVNDGVRDYYIGQNEAQNTSKSITLQQEIIAGSSAGFLQLFVTVPYESVKIQMQMANTATAAHRDSAFTVLKRMGPVGMYRGMTATLLRDVPFCLLFFPLYSNVKELQMKAYQPTNQAGLLDSHDIIKKEPFHVGLVAGIVSGGVSATLVTPADMLKTRIQQKMNGDQRFFEYATQVARKEGMAALFKGWQARVMVIAPLYGIVSLAFEVQKQWLSQ